MTRTPEDVKSPGTVPSIDVAPPLGDVGDPPQAEISVASAPQEATWQAPAQNWRRETGAFESDTVIPWGGSRQVAGQYQGHSQTNRVFPNQRCLAGSCLSKLRQGGAIS
jgi:hypothetical protein